MSAIDDFRNARSVKLSNIRYHYAPPRGIGEPEEERTAGDLCVDKDPGLDLTLTLDNIPVHLTGGMVMTRPGSGPIIRWSIDHPVNQVRTIPRPPNPDIIATIVRVQGSLSVELNAIDPAGIDSLCDGTVAPYFVRLSTLSTMDPSNQLTFHVMALGLRVQFHSTNIRFAGMVGLMPADPAHLDRVEIGRATHRICHPYAERRVFGTVTLDRAVQRAQAPGGTLPYTLTAQSRTGTTLRIVPAAHGVTVGFPTDSYAVIVPAGFSGVVDITAQLGSVTRSAELTVEGPDPAPGYYPDVYLLGCLPQERYLVERPLVEEGLEYRFRDLNDLGDLIGHRDGLAFRYLAGREQEYFGQLIGAGASIESLNNLGQVAGGIVDAKGKPAAFIYGGEEGAGKAGLTIVKNAYFTALNGTGEAAGYRLVKGQPQAMRYANGKVTVLGKSSKTSKAVAINDRGMVACNSTTDKGEQHALLYQTGKVQNLSDILGRPTVASALNENGVVVGYSTGRDGKQEAFAYSSRSGQPLELKGVAGFDSSQALDINDDGVIVGTSFSAKNSGNAPIHGFRYTAKGGMEDLNDVLQNDAGIVVLAALKINNSGQILVYGMSQNKQDGYFLLDPAGI